MASSSSSSSRTLKYDVFPSFSGVDVRKSFLSHLLKELHRRSIITFIDHGIERSRQISPELLSAISDSKISIVVFSKKYASSTWCLNELAAIHECCKRFGLMMVIPVFYNVDPSHVRKQKGEFGKVFDVTCNGKTEDDIERWKKALTEVANIAGEDSQNWSDEAKMIEQISNDVSNKLFTPTDDFSDFVGIEAHIEVIMDSVLCLESREVRMVGIVGTSGIGKSTIARALFSQLASQFDYRAFVSYKRTMQDKKVADFGMKLGWAKQFLSEILCQKDIKIESLGAVEQRLKHKKVLIILDDVDEIELLETLVGETGWFGFGSRIIVVTQDRALLESHEIDLVYEVQFPSENLALQMFCKSAFRRNSPPDGFLELAREVTNLAGNLPLGLNVLGSSLRGKDKEEWVDMMPRLRSGLDGKIEKTLRVCYDGLDEKDDQDIFLYIACLFNGESVNYIKSLLPDSVYTSLSRLAGKSLIRMVGPEKTVQMHILLQKLGREIVRAESINNPGKRRFLVAAKDISDVFKDNTGTENVLGIHLDTSEIIEPLFLEEKSFEGMRNLQFIKFYKDRWAQKTKELIHRDLSFIPNLMNFNKEWWAQETDELFYMDLLLISKAGFHLPRGLVYLPRKLRLLHWDEYPAKYIPCSFSAEYLVELRMEDSKLEKLWEGTQSLQSLKKMNLDGSRDLKEIPDLSNATNLETLNLRGCTSLVTLPSSIRNLKKLIDLCMAGCSNLEVLPTGVNLESLDYLSLSECSRLRSFPRISRNISRLYLDGTAMEEEDCFWIENLSGLTELCWQNCPLRCMPSNFQTEHLFHLTMTHSKLEKLWTGVKSLGNLNRMNLSGCESLREIPDLSKATSLNWVNLTGCENLNEISGLPKATNIWTLDLNNCISLVMLPTSIQHLDKLVTLFMRGCTSLEVLPTNINLVSLKCLDLSGCSRLRSFPQLSTSIEELYLDDTAIEEVPSWIENIAGLTRLWMTGCKKLRKISATIWNLKHLERINFTCYSGVRVTSVSDASPVKTIAEKIKHYTNELIKRLRSDANPQEFILQSDSHFEVLPVKQVPMYFMHRTCGSSLTVPLPQSYLSQISLTFKACIILDHVNDFIFPETIIVRWKFRGVKHTRNIDRSTYLCMMDNLIVFHFDFCSQEEYHDLPSQVDCNNVKFEFVLSCPHCEWDNLQTCPIFPQMIKGCGARVLNVSPSLDANDRSSETEYTDQSGESDVETRRCKKRMRMSIVTSQEHSNLPGGQTLAPISDPSSGLGGASNNFHGDGTLLYHSFSSSYPCLGGEASYVDPMITEQQDTEEKPSVNTSFSSRLVNFFRFWK